MYQILLKLSHRIKILRKESLLKKRAQIFQEWNLLVEWDKRWPYLILKASHKVENLRNLGLRL